MGKRDIFSRLILVSLFLQIMAIDEMTTASRSLSVQNNRVVTYNELLSQIETFKMSGVESYNTMLIDSKNYQLIVGARDYIFRLSLMGLQLLESSEWSSNSSTIQMCRMKGMTSDDCHNYIRLLHINNRRLFVCGTNSFSPTCTWRSLAKISTIDTWERGLGRTPFAPTHTLTSVMTNDQSLYVGTSLDFHGKEGAFLRATGRDLLRTSKYNSKWLSEPSFIDSFESGGFIYFFFRENAVEYMNCGQRVVSRIGRVCKNDQGGSRILKDNWTTFLKARLSCSIPGKYPFDYDNLQSVSYLDREQLFYGVFTTPDSSIAGSAVCVFSMTSVNETFNGAFKYQPSPSSSWIAVSEENTGQFLCEESSHRIQDSGILADKYQLMESSVSPLTTSPVISLDLLRFRHIAIDVVITRQSGPVHVAFVADDTGVIRKLTILPKSSKLSLSTHSSPNKMPETCLLEVLQTFPANTSKEILDFKFLKETNSLYISTRIEVIRLPVDRCYRYDTRHACLAARDPYCGWDTNVLQCTSAPNNDPLNSGWIQHVIGCPSNDEPVDGRWGPWSDWETCSQKGTDENCLCRERECNAPKPARNGTKCEGPRTEVSNCTLHGGWTTWSAWSQCSATCGIAVKTRTRTCTNPTPQHGGRVCVGHSRKEIYCHSLPPCPVYTQLPVDGAWSHWGDWSECSSSCGKGISKRQRTCTNPPPLHGGIQCIGCNEQSKECMGTDCPSKLLSDWTTWVTLERGLERRFRVQCPSQQDQSTINAPEYEDRMCNANGVCSTLKSPRENIWSSWSEWSECDQPCGGGKQRRKRTCFGKCSGSATEERQCNIFKCQGIWSCWSEWTTCSASCGSGSQERSRKCIARHDPFQNAEGCEGISEQHQPCEVEPCKGEEGWGLWSEWSSCSGKEERFRRRKCLSKDPSKCKGLDFQRMSCDLTIKQEFQPTYLETQAGYTQNLDCLSVQTIIGACITCFLLGTLIACLSVYYFCVRKSKTEVPSSPHYIHAKPNQYVSVPSNDWKANTSECHPLNSPTASLKNIKNGIRNAITVLPLKEYDTATIKRSSHSYGNGNIRADLDSDNIFFN